MWEADPEYFQKVITFIDENFRPQTLRILAGLSGNKTEFGMYGFEYAKQLIKQPKHVDGWSTPAEVLTSNGIRDTGRGS